MRTPILGAIAGLLIGLAILGLLSGMALFKDSPGGLDENQMWFGVFSTIWGMPLSLFGGGTSYLAVAVILLLNWLLLGLLTGIVVEFLRRKRE